MVAMTSKQRLLAAIAHREPDRVPIAPRMHLWSVEQYGDYNWLRLLRLQEEFDFDPLFDVDFQAPAYLRQPFTGSYTDLDGISLQMDIQNLGGLNRVQRIFHTPAGTLTDVIELPHPRSRYGLSPSPVVKEPLVKSSDDVDKISYLLPDPTKVQCNFHEMIDLIGERGLLQVHPAAGLGAPMMASVMGMENAMMAFYSDRETFDRLLTIFFDYHQRVTTAILEKGAPVVFMSWHDFGVSGGWSPKIWRAAFKPLIKANVDLVHSYGAFYNYFDNGAIMPLIPDLAEIGVDIVSSLCPPPVGDVDLVKVKGMIGDKVTLHGNVDAIWIVQKGTPEQVHQAVRETIRIGAPGGGFILGNSDAFFMDTPRLNIEAFFRAAHELNTYPIRL